MASGSGRYPFPYEFQQSILSFLIRDPAFLENYSPIIPPERFDFTDLSLLAKVAFKAREKYGHPVNRATLEAELLEYAERKSVGNRQLDAALKTLNRCFELPLEDRDPVIDRVVDFAKRQAVKEAIYKISSKWRDGKDLSDAPFELQRALCTGEQVGSFGLNFGREITSIPSLAAQETISQERKIPSGYESIDAALLGGPARGDICCVIGVSGGGKSSYLTNVICNAVRLGYKGVYITIGDLYEIDVAIRCAANLLKVDQTEVLWGSERFQQRAALLENRDPHLRIKFFPPREATTDTIRAYLSRLKLQDGFSPDIVVIDYPMSLRFPKEHETDSYRALGVVYQQLRRMGNDLGYVTWTAAQAQRVKIADDEVLTKEQIGESWKQVQESDFVISVNQSPREYLEDKMRLWVDKARRGRKFTLVHCDADYSKMSIVERHALKFKKSFSPS